MAIKITWIGCHSEGIQAFSNILKNGYTVNAFITLDDEAFKKRSAGSREYVDLCEQYNVPIKFISTIKNEDAYQKIKEAAPDLLIVLGWSEILPERILDIPTIGTVGAHAAMLPHNRGSAPINWALIKGEKECGNSLMWLDKEVDQGTIIDQMGFEITEFDTCKTLYDRVAETNGIMILRLVERLNNGQNTVMDKANVTDEDLLPRRRPKDGLLNWKQESQKVYDFIRALSRPYPGAFTFVHGEKYLIWAASIVPGMNEGIPGEILGDVYSPLEDACGIQVQCEKGSVIIHEMENEKGQIFSGKKIVKIFDGRFDNGD